MNRLSALMKADAVMSSSTSIWTALAERHVNRAAHLLLLAAPPLVRRVMISQGPKTSTPTKENRGCTGMTRSSGKSDIFWWSSFCLSLLHVTQLWIREDTSLLPPTNQYPEDRMHPSVIWRPWCFESVWHFRAIKVETWCFAGKITGFLDVNSRCEYFSRPPTRKSPSASM